MTLSSPNRFQRLAWIVLAVIALAAGLFIAYLSVIRPWHMRLGMSRAELSENYPSDAYVANPERLTTRGITIQAPVEQVWPWVLQMGADTAGFYSYTWLEGMLACKIRNAGQIHPEWQNVQPGDKVALCPNSPMPPPYEVVAVQPGQALILGHHPTPADHLPGVAWFETWAFILQPVDAHTSRLIIRTRSTVDFGWMKAIEPGVFVMEYGMMHGIKARVERAGLEPSQEMLYRVIFSLLLGLYLAIRFVFMQAPKQTARVTQTLAGERLWLGLILLAMIPAFLYPFTWLDFAHLALPAGLRWTGALVFLAGIGLFYLSHRALGTYWSTGLEVFDNQPVISTGPYRWIRHPMYAAIFLVEIGMLLLSANWMASLPLLAAFAIFYLRRIQAEENLMLAQFGETYRQYMEQTGRLIPRLGK